jgi:capsular polysaccharide biosynthesis protein
MYHKLNIENPILSVPDGLVKKEDILWFKLQKYYWDLNKPCKIRDKHHIRHIFTRLNQGLPDEAIATKINGEYILGISIHEHSYYHFICDILPFLITHPDIPLLVSTKFPNNWERFLISEGFDIWRLNNGIYRIESLLIPPYIEGDWNTEKVELLKDFFSKPIENLNHNSKNYISRKFASRRHLANEDKIIPILKDNNFNIIYLEHLTIFEQVKLFKESSTIISPHGAGLVNIIHAPYDCKIFEIRPLLCSGNYCYDNLGRLGWKRHSVIIPPRVGNFILPVKVLESLIFD